MGTVREFDDHGSGLGEPSSGEGISLLFTPGERPGADQVESLLGSGVGGESPARVSARVDGQGWIELLASGLTFDMSGLSPAAPHASPAPEHFFGLPADMSAFDLESVNLSPGPHIAAGRAMLPVVRSMVGLAANLALHLPVKVVCWQPARSWMDARYFARQTLTWLSGGAFPSLGLTAIRRRDDGRFCSVGLDYFVGQEVAIAPLPAEAPADTVKLGVRIIDHVLRQGAVTTAQALVGPSGEPLSLEPSSDGRELRVKRMP